MFTGLSSRLTPWRSGLPVEAGAAEARIVRGTAAGAAFSSSARTATRSFGLGTGGLPLEDAAAAEGRRV